MPHDPAPFDTDALATITDSSDWLLAFINQAIERHAIDSQGVVDLQAQAEQLDGAMLTHVRQALGRGYPADGLLECEHALFFNLLAVSNRVPSAEAQAYFAAMHERGGGIGYDGQDRLVWGLPGGGVDVVLDADGKPVGTAH